MPFQSEKQRRYLWANEPEIARDWADTYGSRIKKHDGGIMRVGFKKGEGPAGGATIGSGSKQSGSPSTSSNTGKNYGPYSKGPPHTSTGPQDSPHKDVYKKPKPKVKFKSKVKHLKTKQQKRNLVLSLRKLGLMKGWNPFSGTPDWASNMTEAELNAMASDVQGIKDYSQATYNPNLNPTKQGSGSELLGRVFQGGPFNQNTNVLDGGKGYRGYRNYEEWLAAQNRNTGGTEVAEVVEETPSAFQASLTGTADTPDYYVGDNPLASNIAWGKQAGVDPRTMGLTSWADGGRIGRAYGGIMDTETGRKAYGIGSFFKKIGRAAKKVFKSPAGKALLLGGAGWAVNAGMLPGGAGGNWFTNMGPWQKGILLASSLPFFMGGKEDDEEDKGANYDLLRDKYASELMNIKRGVSAGSLNPEQWSYLPQNYTYTGAEGGRAGYYAGGQ